VHFGGVYYLMDAFPVFYIAGVQSYFGSSGFYCFYGALCAEVDVGD
jgi:hypothetical protein